MFFSTEKAPLLLASGDRTIFSEVGSKRVWVSKSATFDASAKGPIFGASYGSVFALSPSTKRFELVEPQASPDEDDSREQLAPGSASVSDNRDLVDRNESQSLTPEQIVAMKDAGASAGDVVKRLVENSSTFTAKTAFAQEKKKKKHEVIVTSLFPSSGNIAEAAFRKDPAKVCFMRPDTLARVVHKAALRVGGKAIVVESCGGLVACSVAERLGNAPGAMVVNVQATSRPSKERPSHAAHFRRPLAPIEPVAIAPMIQSIYSPSFEFQPDSASAPAALSPAADSLVVATRFWPLDIVVAMLPYLAPSGTLVVYCSIQRPLEQLADVLTGCMACDVEISETWLREYQVLPQRTHPTMDMHGSSGFILSAIKVNPGPKELANAIATFRRYRPSREPAAPAAPPAPPKDVQVEQQPTQVKESDEPETKKQKTAD